MENIILSLLLIKSMTIYEMSTFIQQNLMSICSGSFGSIQAGLKKLLAKGCIECYEYTENNVIKKEYRITDEGLMQFNNWIKEPINLEKIKNMEEGKFFFLGMAGKQVRINSLKGYIESLEYALVRFNEIKKLVESTKGSAIRKNVERIRTEDKLEQQLLTVSGEEELTSVVENIYRYQMYDLEYALNRIEEDIDFYKSILKNEMEE